MAWLQDNRSWIWLLIAGGIWVELLGCLADPASAQITPDETLGGERSVVNRDVQVRGDRGDRIDGGARRGANLFHSFREFNVNEGQRVYFANPAGVANILGRVTGIDVSDIMGTLGVDGGANLFLLNPNGIVFGPNAFLDVSGSFIATTGNRFNFPDGSEFSAINPQAPSFLTVSAPVGVQFGGNPGGITVTGISDSSSSLFSRRTLALVGGDIRLDGASFLSAGGRIDLGAARAGTVNFNQSGNLFSLSFPKATERANISITNGSSLGLLFGGSIALTAQNLDILDSSLLAAQFSFPGLETFSGEAGDVTLDVSEATNINQGSMITNIPGQQGGGNIRINTGSLSVAGSSDLSTDTIGLVTNDNGNTIESDAGDIVINARGAVSFVDGSASTGVFPGARGNGGNIEITAGSFSATGGSRLSTSTSGIGNSGDITINAPGEIVFADGSSASTEVSNSAIGNGGNISINAGSLSVQNKSELNAGSLGRGNAGNISVNARDDVTFSSRSFLGSAVTGPSAIGRAGNLEVAARNFSANSSNIETRTEGQGDAGRIVITARDSASFSANGAGILNSTVGNNVANATGNGGDIVINASSITFNNFTSTAEVAGRGNSGRIVLNADDAIIFQGSKASSAVADTGIGNGGNIEINTGTLTANQSGLITGMAGGRGNAGSVIITARNSVNFSDGGVYTNLGQRSIGIGGDIRITTDALSVREGSQLFASAEGLGRAGNIIINARDRVLIDGVRSYSGRSSSLSSSTEALATGQGGNITVNTPSLQIDHGGLISARTASPESGGNIIINADTLEARNGGQIITNTESSGQAGNITLNIGESIFLSGIDPTYNSRLAADKRVSEKKVDGVDMQGEASGLYANATNGSTGQSGSISITTGELNVQDRALIAVGSQGTGQAGSLTVNAHSVTLNNQASLTAGTLSSSGGNINLQISDSLRLDNSSEISASTQTGQGGNIRLNRNQNRDQAPTNSVELAGDSSLTARATGSGNAGNITLNAREVTVRGDSNISASTTSGTRGNITLQGLDRLQVTNGEISASTQTGRAGSLRVDAAESIRLSNGRLTVQARNGEAAGNLSLNTRELSLRDGSEVTVSSTGSGQSGRIDITAQDVELRGGSEITASTENGRGGSLSIGDGNHPTRSIEVRGDSRIATEATGTGDAGTLTLDAQQIAVVNGGLISASTQSGRGGDINLWNLDELEIINGEISASAKGGTAGNLTIETDELTLDNGAQVTVSNTGAGRAGNLSVTAREVQLSDQSKLTAETEAARRGGNINLQISDSLQLNNNSQISASTQTGQGGNIRLNRDRPPTNSVELAGNSSLAAQATGSGAAGEIDLNARAMTVRGRSNISASTTSGQGGDITLRGLNRLQVNNGEISASTEMGQAGNLTVNASESIDLRNHGRLAVEAEGGGAGNLTLQTDRLTLRGGSEATVSSKDTGTAGDLTVRASEISLNRSSLTADTVAGSGGDINLQDVDRLTLQNGSEIAATTQDGQGGRVRLNQDQQPAERVQLNRGSQITTTATGRGAAGRIDLNTTELMVQGRMPERNRTAQSVDRARSRSRSSTIAATSRSNQGGNIQINADRVTVQDKGSIAASTQTGRAGDLTVNAEDSVQLDDRGSLTVEARRERGRAGNLTVNTRELSLTDSSTIAASNVSDHANGNRANSNRLASGNITLQGLETLEVEDSRISASTETGQAGSLTVDADDSIELNNGRLLVRATEAGGRAGGLSLATDRLTANNSQVSVSSNQGRAGNLRIDASSMILDNGSVTAQAGRGSGAEVSLDNLDLLYLQDGSEISARATDQANGGNVTIDAADGFVVVPLGADSDIIANAAQGRGGNIQISTQGIFGITEGQAIPDNGTNDIDASSEAGIQGSVTINRPNTDPSRGLTELPTDIIDPSNQVNRVCPTGSATSTPSEFVITGRGGLPANPEAVLNGETLLADWVTLDDQSPTTASSEPEPIAEPVPEDPLIEAQGWVKGASGEVIFKAQAPTPAQTSNLQPSPCR